MSAPDTITVIAAKGVRVSLEHDHRRHIDDTAAVPVVDSAYYQRRLADGDLLLRQPASNRKGK